MEGCKDAQCPKQDLYGSMVKGNLEKARFSITIHRINVKLIIFS